jgi:hypothetical protein
VLAQADWLVMLYPSSYSTTAAEVGFGTSGITPGLFRLLLFRRLCPALAPQV